MSNRSGDVEKLIDPGACGSVASLSVNSESAVVAEPATAALQVIQPAWPAPARVGAIVTLRTNVGASQPPYADFNLALHVGDEIASVEANRARLLAALPGCQAIQWLNQQHTDQVIMASAAEPPLADGVYSRSAGMACAILTADCLPILFCDRQGTQVMALHAGWRGLLAGIVERGLKRWQPRGQGLKPADVLAWIGPAISAKAYEVGEEVRAAFLSKAPQLAEVFLPGNRQGKYWFDLPAAARRILTGLGVAEVYGGGLCTHTNPQAFYSYRRDQHTGRQASLIWLKTDRQA